MRVTLLLTSTTGFPDGMRHYRDHFCTRPPEEKHDFFLEFDFGEVTALPPIGTFIGMMSSGKVPIYLSIASYLCSNYDGQTIKWVANVQLHKTELGKEALLEELQKNWS